MPRREPPGAASPLPDDDFFLPDLCAPRAVFFAVLLAELLVLVHHLADSVPAPFDWQGLGPSSLFVQWCVLLSSALLCVLRPLLARFSLPLVTVASLAVVASVTALSSGLARLAYPPTLASVQAPGWILRNVLVAVLLAAIVLRYFYLQQQLGLQQRAGLQARLSSLRSRIHPHFLFNALNSIASLIGARPAAAESAVEDLADLLRASLREDEQETTVAEELALCERYLAIEALRLGDRLAVSWAVDDSARKARLPSLLLQPLLENAVNHGIARLPGGGRIRVVIETLDGELRLSVVNPMPGDGEHGAGSGEHLALDNIRQRLSALYPDRHRFRAAPAGDSYAVAVRLPLALGS
ncbi:sensor histidine kinase [Pseudohaliea rubra]|uniref:Alginate biosynthesis protein AlgZ/FimS n=1 Tax=Pseudohaliea rubra DSM 19751 TaxID=1265313 RepID=A0A095XWF1_9GAMM|nr:histidine kinase [Pseudohaliea rubra]KGE04016.1 Alginate biosynthesis protein AlgZ/FimS [Pseudohaliea rubra DSM 19751]